MSGFDHVETAAAVREIIGSLAEQRIQAVNPSPNYGRVISVNTTSLSATVWFPGDDSPVSVNMFPNLVPAAWHEQAGSGVANTSYYGYGSQVEVADFNGKKYITQILTDAVMWPEARIMSPTVISQVATEVAQDQAGVPTQLVGEQYETFINCTVSTASLVDGGCISFGPFTTKNQTLPGMGWIEMTVTEVNGATKYFRFPVNPPQDFQHTGGTSFLDDWFRIIPEQQICNPDSSTIIDFDLDVAIKRTVYGLTDEFTPSDELWFRIVKRGSWTGLNARVSIRATNIQRGRSLSGRKLFMQETLVSPPAHKGFLGFHNAQHIYRDIDDYGFTDDFGRTLSTTWGQSDSGPTWTGQSGGPFSVNGSVANISPTGNYVSYITLSSGTVLNPDIYWETTISAMPTGAEVQHGLIGRYTGSSNMIILKINFNTSGAPSLSVVQVVAGVATTVGSDVFPSVTFTAGSKLRCRARLFGTTAFIKVWNPASQREPDWQKVAAGMPFGASDPLHKVGFMVQPGGANSNTKPITVTIDKVRGNLYVKGQDNTGRQWHTGPWRSGLLRVADNLQKTMMLDGKWIWDGTNFGWTGQIRFGGIGQHRYGLAAASGLLQFADTAASGFSVPVVPGGTARTISGQAVQLNVGESLWCAIQPGQTWENMYEYLFIVTNTAIVDYDLPEWAVMIAMRADTSSNPIPEIRTGNGVHVDKWRSVVWANGNLADFGASHDTCQYKFDSPGVVRLKGLGKHTTSNYTGNIFTLPAAFTPVGGIQLFQILSSGAGTGFSRMDIAINGDVSLNSHGTNGGTNFFSLNGITFSVHA